jgi:hypothetical protein
MLLEMPWPQSLRQPIKIYAVPGLVPGKMTDLELKVIRETV